ncbi:hypothetical protein Tco_1048016, partial [Tanacetum coccineum]
DGHTENLWLESFAADGLVAADGLLLAIESTQTTTVDDLQVIWGRHGNGVAMWWFGVEMFLRVRETVV